MLLPHRSNRNRLSTSSRRKECCASSRKREIVGLEQLESVLPNLKLDKKPLSETQKAGVRAVLVAHQQEQERRATKRAEIADLTKRIVEQKRDFRQRYSGKASQLLQESTEHQALWATLSEAKNVLTLPGGVAPAKPHTAANPPQSPAL
jgi:hypothetical protein